MNKDYIGTNDTHAALTDDTLVKCEQFEEFKKETKDYLRIMQNDTIILQDKIIQTSIELKKEIEQLRKHTNTVFFSITSLLLIILSHQLYAIFSK